MDSPSRSPAGIFRSRFQLAWCAAALVTGNAGWFKPSERASVMGYRLAEIMRASWGAGGRSCSMCPVARCGRGRHSGACRDDRVDGSRDAGLGIMQTAAVVQSGQRFVKRVIAEMGGKNAIIVDDTADLDEAGDGRRAVFHGVCGAEVSACSR